MPENPPAGPAPAPPPAAPPPAFGTSFTKIVLGVAIVSLKNGRIVE